ncbi:hypothetical protein [Aquimarina longa]|uniref:hypothetical protein n=1 Tax=Aquimarina longa TaxID=1080221 RepID=UPI00078460BE|nr:hypothetical protein [Aquimarina longa]
MPKTKFIIAGLQFEPKFCKKINTTLIESWEISANPLSNIYKTQKEGVYTVNIIVHIPHGCIVIPNGVQSGFDLIPKTEHKNTLFFQYNGVSSITTSINKPDDHNNVLCRDFGIVYEYELSENEHSPMYDLYHIQIDYTIIQKSALSVEAILVQDTNLDPETDRGTVTAVRTGGQ